MPTKVENPVSHRYVVVKETKIFKANADNFGHDLCNEIQNSEIVLVSNKIFTLESQINSQTHFVDRKEYQPY